MADLNNYVSGGGKTVKTHEIRDRVCKADDAELKSILDDCARELLNLRTQAMLQQVPNPMRIRHVRKLIARVQTEQTARRHKAEMQITAA
ncbi:ribosomal protein L29 [Abditibacterium utsteinense]|uniref:Large ribosomal subunit protein uL29 n=1 Tax=Abditibacterium utsteinense TaxID=1960156 RepID=A0A2S8ST26_9BACT|nr:50S ribosomal protein L29 [Abditibacterium utsteinense]PQV63951.1 ribosomal protein L29 [Abditibacterium utsteinense]